jgi:signal transduction histidine kinase
MLAGGPGRTRGRPIKGGGSRTDTAAVSRDPRSQELPAWEVARLAALWRLALGASHSLNNALTAIVGEASFLRDDRKGDAAVGEACDAILAEVDRCARLIRALLARRHPPQQGGDEVDLGRLVGDLARLLPDTLGSRIDLRLELGSDLLPVAGNAADLELLCLLLVQLAADLQPGPARVALGVEGDAERAVLRVSLHAPLAGSGSTLGSPAGPPLERVAVDAVRAIAEAHGGRLCLSGHEDALEIRASFPLLTD